MPYGVGKERSLYAVSPFPADALSATRHSHFEISDNLAFPIGFGMERAGNTRNAISTTTRHSKL